MIAYTIGILGMLVIITGSLLMPSLFKSVLFLAGPALLALTAWMNGNRLFMALQTVAISGALLGFFNLKMDTTIILILVCAILCIFWLYIAGELVKTENWIGIAGLVILSMGFASQHLSPTGDALLLVASVLISIFSTIDLLRGRREAWLWLILNLFFCLAGLVRIILA